MPTSGNYFHLHLVSDSTGETLITVARAVAAQYANVTPVEHVYPLVRSQKQLDRVLDEIEEAPGIVLFTLLVNGLTLRPLMRLLRLDRLSALDQALRDKVRVLSLTEGSTAEKGQWLIDDAVAGLEKAVREEFAL